MLASKHAIKAIFLIFIIAVTGCAKSTYDQSEAHTTFTKRFMFMSRAPLEQLKSQGVQVIQVGDNVKFVLAADSVFASGTPRLQVNYYPVLNMLIKVLNQYEKITIKIAGYTDSSSDELRNLALSRQQARNLAQYLWSHGLDSRILYAEGYGSSQPIATNETLFGRATNRRIEITLRNLPVVEE